MWEKRGLKMKITKIETITLGLPYENPGPESSFAIADKNFLKSLLFSKKVFFIIIY